MNAGHPGIDTADALRRRYAGDCWPVAVKMAMRRGGGHDFVPDGVARPSSVAELAGLLAFADASGLPVTPWGAGSGVTGAALAARGGVVVDLSAMDAVLDLNERDLTVTVEAGLLGGTLERHLNQRGFTLNHVPQSLERSSVGGWVATRATGQFSSKYGGIETLLVGCRVVLASGEVVDTRRTPRSAVGVDLQQLFVGSEGCLGVVVEVTLKIFPLAAGALYEALAFDRLEDGLEALRLIARDGLKPHIARYYDADEARHVVADSAGRNLMLLGFDGVAGIAAAEREAALAVAREQGGAPLGPAPVERWLERRFDFSKVERLLAEPGGLAETIEVSHFWSGIGATYARLKQELAPLADEVLGHFSHLYAQGTSLYVILLGRVADDEEAVARLKAIWDVAMRICLETGASISHHHGVGLARHPYVRADLDSSMLLLERLKAALDPHGIMNPGKLGLGDVPK